MSSDKRMAGSGDLESGHRSFVYRRRVQWGDVDQAGMWKFVAALLYVEEAEVEMLRDCGVLDQTYPMLPRVYVDAQFQRPVAFGDEVEVHLQVMRIGASSIHYGWGIVHAGEVAAYGRLGVVLVGDDGRSHCLPDSVRKALDGACPDPR